MKSFLVASSVLASSLLLFGSGVVATTIWFTNAERPHQFNGLYTADLWTNQPTRVNPAEQDLERLPSQAVVDATPETEKAAQIAAATQADTFASHPARQASPGIDSMATGAIAPDAMPAQEPAPVVNEAHVAWCSNRYRSYNAADNSYRPYGGGMRACVSPYGEQVIGAAPAPGDELIGELGSYGSTVYRRDGQRVPHDGDEEIGTVQTTAYESRSRGATGWEHEQKCLAMYRSYRAEDNSYQPYDGGPRRQCE